MKRKITRTTGREEDYRDYEERDLDEGWPYADATPGSDTKIGNSSYGQTGQNFDDAGNPGFERSSDTAIKSADGPDLFSDDVQADVEDDALEETIANALLDSDIDTSGMDLKVRRGIALLTGEVETAQDRRRIERFIYDTPGISDVRNELTLRGADGNIPSDWDD
ncbi:BON domain-containing protein [Pararhizobium sp. LjRoot238]|uniref:BON domain-containing protein n=1 Tax=Pararhizobium sp. LjRoot238 TaxID=3342293 RepID=UPI003ECE3518